MQSTFVINFNCSQVSEEYEEEEEREKFNEELLAIKKRFSHPKIKRKWVSIAVTNIHFLLRSLESNFHETLLKAKTLSKLR